MATVFYSCIILYLSFVRLVTANTYSVSLLTEEHVNLVDSKFLSFTIDPKYLFLTSEKYNSKECVCMATSLAPAYLRIAGPSTAHMTFHNTTISINDIDFDLAPDDLEIEVLDTDSPKKIPIDLKTVDVAVTHREWRKFISWAKETGFSLVFALNNEERTSSGLWDPNTALNILTVAEKAKVGDMFWEFGYECKNQSIEEYLNDLETLRVITETFPPGRMGEWKVVGGDVTKCLQVDSKSDFKDYLVLSNDMMDALLLNGNSSYQELERMSERSRLKLLQLLSHSKTPLWLTETSQRKYNQLERAADWLASLGYAAKSGFSVHYRELEEEEIYEPTLSFYMALLFKNLVGERVLNVEMVPEQAILFGHCTSLRHKRVPGAVTLFGVNMDEEPARFSLKLPKREEGGDIMQFILGHDLSGNIVVNGRAMYYEGDINPVVKRVRPFKTLLVTLPPKSFGFWVLANTNIEACQDADNSNNSTNSTSEEDAVTENLKVRRSLNDGDVEEDNHIANLFYDLDDAETTIGNKHLIERITDINRDLNKIHNSLCNKKTRVKREDDEHIFAKMKLRKFKPANERNFDLDPAGILGNILLKARQNVEVLKNRGFKEVKRRLNRNRVNKRHSRNFRVKDLKAPMRYFDTQNFVRNLKKTRSLKQQAKHKSKKSLGNFNHQSKNQLKSNQRETEETDLTGNNFRGKQSRENEITKDILETKTRRRRNVDNDVAELSSENDIDFEEIKKAKLWKILKKIQEDMKGFSQEDGDEETSDVQEEGIVLRTELSDDTATIKVKDAGKGLIGSTMKNMVNVLEDLNKNLNRFWDVLSMLG